MNYKLAVVLYLHVTSVWTLMKVQLMPLQYGMLPQNTPLQLQNPFLRQPVSNIPQPHYMYPQQPILVLIPNTAPTATADDRYINLNEENTKNSLKSNKGHIDEENDAVILDADPNSAEVNLKKASAIMPNGGRFSIGTIISYIPFLPIEINVPDTISWISSLWPSLTWPFGGSAEKPENTKRLSNKGPLPILMFPGQMMPQIQMKR